MSVTLKHDLSMNGSAPLGALPDSWYSSPEIFELERRAIFSRKWLLTTHKLRFAKTGDWLRYNSAGFSFILVRDKEGGINAFHNVCRHRAFPVVTDEGGTSRIFSCKYHGWSYGLTGKLAKAPGYQDLEGFDKSKNGLFPIHVHIDNNGFIWVNLDGGESPEISWENDLRGVDLQSSFKEFNIENFSFDHTLDVNIAYNWKILACSHTGDMNDDGFINNSHTTSDQVARGLQIASTYYFPNASMVISPNLFCIKRFMPTSSTNCEMRYEIYRNINSSDEDFEMTHQELKRIMSEDKDLCANTQRSLSSGAFADGESGSHMDKGTIQVQNAVRDLVLDHYKREAEVGHEIWPSRQTLPTEAQTSKEDVDFCAKLSAQNQTTTDCSTQSGGCCGGMACQSGNQALAY
ncbi:hypothetical protein N7462_006723 [Penicillium macrosclerotiorum]|uniref:uncharacterized protein n=1 Tax=Penicillium macrosclerotiorum TaxID=303699 RepID=UPI002547EEB6|nr:uncharacterized protein N7462_006723 [Penicillium macrosclerotiorum]KAJ5683558.1 hypothetical protein N7462_006723 [Penicillium macrosclerotiorum]